MKKKIAGAVLAGLIVRVAMLAGAGEAVGGWVRELNADGRLVTATLNIELGGGARSAAAEPADDPAPTEVPQTAAPAVLLVEVTPQPAEETPVPVPTETPTVVAADLSADAKVNDRAGTDIDLAVLAAEGFDLRLEAGAPQVLIFHTHSSEAYTPDGMDEYEASDPYRTEDRGYNVVRVGDVLTEKLEAAGLTVIHDREIYDYPSYTGSYSRSGAAVERYLAEYPSIRVVIDLHRDALGSDQVVYKTLADVQGRTCAQVMMLVGTGANGLWHPNWQENLKLALYLQNAVDGVYPTLTRPIELVSERYNQQLSPGMLILEVGTSGNTLREALSAVALYGDAVGPALARLVE